MAFDWTEGNSMSTIETAIVEIQHPDLPTRDAVGVRFTRQLEKIDPIKYTLDKEPQGKTRLKIVFNAGICGGLLPGKLDKAMRKAIHEAIKQPDSLALLRVTIDGEPFESTLNFFELSVRPTDEPIHGTYRTGPAGEAASKLFTTITTRGQTIHGLRLCALPADALFSLHFPLVKNEETLACSRDDDMRLFLDFFHRLSEITENLPEDYILSNEKMELLTKYIAIFLQNLGKANS